MMHELNEHVHFCQCLKCNFFMRSATVWQFISHSPKRCAYRPQSSLNWVTVLDRLADRTAMKLPEALSNNLPNGGSRTLTSVTCADKWEDSGDMRRAGIDPLAITAAQGRCLRPSLGCVTSDDRSLWASLLPNDNYCHKLHLIYKHNYIKI